MARDQRRLAAIASVDVVGYSLLMGRDDSATLAGLKAHRQELFDPKIAEYGGRIVKTTAHVDSAAHRVDQQKGETAKTMLAKADLLQQQRQMSIAYVKALRLSDDSIFLQQMEDHVYPGLRKAGIPEN